MGLRINDTIPNLTVDTDQGTFSLHEWIGDSWASVIHYIFPEVSGCIMVVFILI